MATASSESRSRTPSATVSVSKLVEDFFADRVVDFGQRREVEVLPHQFDEARPQLRIERLDQVADVGLVQVADEFTQLRRIRRLDRLRNTLDKVLAHRPVRPPQRRRARSPRSCLFLRSCRALRRMMGRICWACTLDILSRQSRSARQSALAERTMSHPLARYSLSPSDQRQEWAAYHAIRRDAIFAALLPGQAYDENHADEFKSGKSPARPALRRRHRRDGADRPDRRRLKPGCA